VGDFNGDGIPDLAVASATVNILLGNGDGTFQPVQAYAAGSSPTSLATGDFNHDGHLDIAVGAEGAMSVLAGNGDGTFELAHSYAAGGSSTVVADFNGDGNPDIAVPGYPGVFILLGKGDFTFQAARAYTLDAYFISSVAVADFNGDGVPDLAVANQTRNGTVLILLGKGDGTFQPAQSYPAGVYPMFLVAADFNGDGISDLAVLNYDLPSTVLILFGNGDGTFKAGPTCAVGRYARFMAVGDFNGDGTPDLVVANTGIRIAEDMTVSVLVNHGDGTFQAAQNYTVGSTPTSVAVGDFNSDGHLDIVVSYEGSIPGTLSILFGNGDGTFQVAQNYTFDAGDYSYVQVVAGDFNGDGHLDLAVSNAFDESVTVLLGNGDGTFQAGQKYRGYGRIAIGDFNRDGALDLVVSLNLGAVAVSLGNGDGTFQAAQAYPVGDTPFPIAVADFNGDGFPDLAVGTSGGVTILINAADW
jgi:hypothetical protein